MSLISRSVIDRTKEEIISFFNQSKGSTWESMMIDTFYQDFKSAKQLKQFGIPDLISLLEGNRDINIIKFLVESSLGSSWVMEMCLTWYGEFDIEGKVCFNIHTILLCM